MKIILALLAYGGFVELVRRVVRNGKPEGDEEQ